MPNIWKRFNQNLCRVNLSMGLQQLTCGMNFIRNLDNVIAERLAASSHLVTCSIEVQENVSLPESISIGRRN